MSARKVQLEPSPPVSEQMRAWSSALAAELRQWPQVRQKVFFGFSAFYRGKTMFALLPRTRSIFKENALALRIEKPGRAVRTLLEKDRRIAAFDKDKRRWFSFEISRDCDLHEALEWLGRAFEAARRSKKTQ